MALSLQEQLRAKRAETELWIRAREAAVRRAAAEAEAAGRRVYERAIKTGQQVIARTPAEIRQLGVAAAQGRLPEAIGGMVAKAAVLPKAKPSSRPAGASAKAVQKTSAQIGSAGRRVDAAVSGFVDEASFGLADHALALGAATGEALQGGRWEDFGRDYSANMDAKRTQDEYDAKHHGLARNVGRATGFVGSVALAGAPGVGRAILAAVPKGRVAKQVVDLGLRYGPDPRGLTTMSALGGTAAGVIDEVVGNAIADRRTTIRDLGAAAVGGMLGGVSTRYVGPGFGGAIAGGGTSILGDVAHSRAISLNDAARSAQAGAVLGAIGGEVGVDHIRNLKPHGKGQVGDTLSRLKAISRGERITGSQQRIHLDPVDGRAGGYTVADVVSRDPQTGRMILTESKMGPYATLSPRQIQARNQFGDDYVVDHWSFSDVGKASGAAVAPLGAVVVDRSEYPRR